jgi:hypothetical protein
MIELCTYVGIVFLLQPQRIRYIVMGDCRINYCDY